MNKGTIWTVLGVVASVIVAWVLVNALFSLLAFVFKLAFVAVVALIVFAVMRHYLTRGRSASRQ